MIHPPAPTSGTTSTHTSPCASRSGVRERSLTAIGGSGRCVGDRGRYVDGLAAALTRLVEEDYAAVGAWPISRVVGTRDATGDAGSVRSRSLASVAVLRNRNMSEATSWGSSEMGTWLRPGSHCSWAWRTKARNRGLCMLTNGSAVPCRSRTGQVMRSAASGHRTWPPARSPGTPVPGRSPAAADQHHRRQLPGTAPLHGEEQRPSGSCGGHLRSDRREQHGQGSSSEQCRRLVESFQRRAQPVGGDGDDRMGAAPVASSRATRAPREYPATWNRATPSRSSPLRWHRPGRGRRRDPGGSAGERPKPGRSNAMTRSRR